MDSKPLYRSAPDTPSGDGTDGKRSGLPWVRTTLSLGGVVGLIVLLAWGYKAVSGGGSFGLPLRGRGANVIEIISRTALSPKQTICLVRVGPQLLLLGVTNESVRTLHVIEDANLASQLLGMAAQGRADSQSAEFTRWLSSAAREYTGEPDSHEPAETIAPEEQRLSEIKQKLAGTLARLRTKAAGA